MPITINGRKFSIIRKASLNEYQITVVENGKRIEKHTLLHNDLDDANGTLRAMLMQYIFQTCEKGTFRVVHR